MKAVCVHAFGSLEDTRLEEVPAPEPGPGEIVVDVHAAPVNYVDLVTFSGEYQFTPALPYTPGKGPSGVVRSVGEGVPLAPGDRVLAMAESGGYAESVLVPHTSCYRLPDDLTFVDAVSMSLAFDTAWMALRDRARLARGEDVLVLGATGAVGMAAVQLARALGAGRVLAASTSPDRLADGPAIDAAIDLGGPDLRDSVREQVLAATEGRGVDVVIDPVGGDAFDGAIRALAWRGRLVVVGFAAGRIPTIKANYLLLKNIEVSGLQISDYRKRTPDLMATCFREVFDLCTAGRVRPLPTTTMPLSEWRTAMEMVRDRTTSRRVILLPAEEGVSGSG